MPIDISLLHSVKWDANVNSMWHWKQAPSLLSQSGFRLCGYWTSPICQGGDGACCITGFPPSSHCNAQTDFHLLFATVLSGQSWEITVTEEVWWLPKEVVTVALGYPCKYLNTQRAPPIKSLVISLSGKCLFTALVQGQAVPSGAVKNRLPCN